LPSLRLPRLADASGRKGCYAGVSIEVISDTHHADVVTICACIANAESNSLTHSISAAYSNVDMQMGLITQKNAQACVEDECIAREQFDTRVLALGERLAHAAYAVYPDLKKRVPSFEFKVVNKIAAATTSTANGRVIVFRGLQQLALGDEALSYVLAREMGHVIGQHHKQICDQTDYYGHCQCCFPCVGHCQCVIHCGTGLYCHHCGN